MNARLMNTAPESLHRQTESWSALCTFFIETRSQYLDLNFRTLKSSLSLAREHLKFENAAEPAHIFEEYSSLMKASLGEAGEFITQVGTLSSASQRQLQALLEENWVQNKAVVQNITEKQLELIGKLFVSMTNLAKSA